MTTKLPHLPEVDKWKEKNGDFSLLDFLHAINREKHLAPDYLVAVFKLFWPDFIEVQGCIFLKENYDAKKHGEYLAQGMAFQKIEYWMNLVSIDGLFEGSGDFESLIPICRYVGTQLVPIWRSKLETEFPGKKFSVECVLDKEEDEVFMVFYRI